MEEPPGQPSALTRLCPSIKVIVHRMAVCPVNEPRIAGKACLKLVLQPASHVAIDAQRARPFTFRLQPP